MTPAVSVVTIFRDAARYLQEAIDSVVAQTFTDWELLLVDDGSSDASTAVARSAVARDADRVRYLEHPGHANRGMSASRNLGVASARAPFIAFLDADDLYLPAKLSHQVSLMDEHPEAGMVYGPTTLWFGWTGDPRDAAKDRVYPTRVPARRPIDPPDLFVSYMRTRAPTPLTCSVLVRREAVQRAGGFEESFAGMYEDKVFFHNVALREVIVVSDRSLDLYRQHDESTSARALASGEWHRRHPNVANARFMSWVDTYARSDPPHAALVRRELRRAQLRQRWEHSRAGRGLRLVRRAARRRMSSARRRR